MNYLDMETSAEAIQEEEELIEAVNEIVETAATAIYTDIKKDVTGVMDQIQHWVEIVFPFLIDWQQHPEHFWIDMQRVGLVWIIFLLSFWMLTPSSRWKNQQAAPLSRNQSQRFLGRKGEVSFDSYFSSFVFSIFRKTGQKHGCSPRKRPTLERSRSTSSIGVDRGRKHSLLSFGRVRELEIEEESEEEKFAKRWPFIKATSYASLVLPPQCKRVEKPKNYSKGDQDSTSTNKNKGKSGEHAIASDEENPAQRLKNYTRQLLHLIMSFFRYDYIGAGRTLIQWAEAWIRNQRNRKSEAEQVGTDDESDAGYPRRSSLSSQSSINSTLSIDATTRTSNTSGAGKMNRSKMRGKRDSLLRLADAAKNEATNDSRETPRQSLVNSVSRAEGDEEKKEISGSDLAEGQNSLATPPQTPDVNRQRADTDYETPRRDFDENDIGGDSALATRVALNPRYNGIPKLRDALGTYRNVASNKGKSLLSGQITQSPMLQSNFMSSGDSATSSDSSLYGVHAAMPSLPSSVLNSLGKEQTIRSESVGSSYYFEAASTNESLKQMQLDVPVPDKNGYIVGDDFLPGPGWTPLLVFVNSRSGPQQGHLLITQLRGLLNPMQVWDLADGGPEEILESFANSLSRMRILVCGGDGTVSWIVSTIEKMKLPKWPPIAILPLGTGNDLARIHGWGGGYNNESLTEILEQVAESYISWLDRWEMTIEDKRGKIREKKEFFNYLGVGADAQAALQVHLLRESRPQLFFSRVVNKAWYGIFGAEDIVKATSLNVPHEITLIADGVEVPLPSDSQGIILLNIDSYAGGCALWSQGTKAQVGASSPRNLKGEDIGSIPLKRSQSLDTLKSTKAFEKEMKKPPKKRALDSLRDRADSVEDLKASLQLSEEERYHRVTACDRPSSCQDGFLDIVSIRGAFHLGQIRVGLSNAQKLGQCREAKIIVKRKVSVQIDGEPWRQNVCTLHVKRKENAAIMLHRSANESNGVETEMANLLDWASDRELIAPKVHDAMMKEFSRRIESKTRERREKRHYQNTFLKRAIGSSSGTNLVQTSNAAPTGSIF